MPVLAPLVVLEVWLLMSATDQLIIAVATFIIALAGVLPTIVTLWTHSVQQKQLGVNAAKLDRIDQSTNGTLTAMRAELASVRAELVAQRDQASKS